MKQIASYLALIALTAFISHASASAACIPTQSDSIRTLRDRDAAGDFVDLRETIPGVIIDLKYAGSDNVFGQVLYTTQTCLLRRDAALALAEVQAKLKRLGLELVIWDGYRPLSVQKKMWQQVPDERYVANPEKGSRHNRGAAVDVTLADSTGRLLQMPTDYDDFSERAHRGSTAAGEEAAGNAGLLERIMQSAGFIGLPTEWWHFDFAGWEKYPVTDLDPDKVLEAINGGE